LGTSHPDRNNDNKWQIVTHVPAGTPIPHTSEWRDFCKINESRQSLFSIYEATVSAPDEKERDRDYRLVHDQYHDHGQVRPEKYGLQSRIVIDEKHLCYIEIREPENSSMGVVRYPFKVDFK
jgi:hypothetical protein